MKKTMMCRDNIELHSKRNNIEKWIKKNTFHCKQLNAKISLKCCDKSIRMCNKLINDIDKQMNYGSGFIGGISKNKNITAEIRLMLCSGCRNKKIDKNMMVGGRKLIKYLKHRYMKKVAGGANMLCDMETISHRVNLPKNKQ